MWLLGTVSAGCWVVRVRHRRIIAGTGYLSQDDHWLHFGTGTIDSVQIKVHWPGGRVESLGRMGVRQHVRINSGNDG